MDKKLLFYTEVIIDLNKPALKALDKSIELVKESGEDEIIICVPQRGTLQGFEDVILNEKMSESLINRGVYKLAGISFYASTNQRACQQFNKGVLLGLEAKPEQIEKWGNDSRFYLSYTFQE